MLVVTGLKEQLQETNDLKEVAVAFSMINSLKIKRIRQMFDTNQAFYDDVIYLYRTVNVTAHQQGVRRKHGQGGKPRTVSIAVTSNHRFYGHMNINVMDKFVDSVQTNYNSDVIVVGKTGLDYLKYNSKTIKFKPHLFKHDNPPIEELNSFLDNLADYDSVLVFYPRFLTVLTLDVGAIDIAQLPSVEETLQDKGAFIFEPDLPKLLVFLEKQLRYLLFSRLMLEAELSRTAARLVTMTSMEERADEMIKEKQIQLSLATKSLRNAQLLSSLAGVHGGFYAIG